jgi:tRNA(Ile)-lysidine synthase
VIRLLGKIPDTVIVACSGGPDSMAALDFLSNGKRRVTAAYFNHCTPHGYQAKKFLIEYCKTREVSLHLGEITREKSSRESHEEYWRNERYRFFKTLEYPVVTGHQLDDAVEWWVYTSLHGDPRLMPYENSKYGIIRPFLLTPRSEMLSWAQRKHVPYVSDPSNQSMQHARNVVRHRIIPACLDVHPGLPTVIRKKLTKSVKHYSQCG